MNKSNAEIVVICAFNAITKETTLINCDDYRNKHRGNMATEDKVLCK